MSIHGNVYGKCWKCSALDPEGRTHFTDWMVKHGFVDDVGLAHILVCPHCGQLVPSYSWERYQRSGVVLKNPSSTFVGKDRIRTGGML